MVTTPAYVDREVESIVCKYGLLPPEELAGALRVDVLEVPLPHGHIRGASLGEYIIVDANLPRRLRRRTLLHECGHRVLHPGWNRFFLQKATFYPPGQFELEAELFGLLYTIRWDSFWLEECGNLYYFADSYGFWRRAVDAVVPYIVSHPSLKLLVQFGGGNG